MDTVGQQGSVALLQDGEPVGSALLTQAAGHVVSLPKEINNLLALAGWKMADVELLAVTLGPGSFTGLRIALGFAKGLALGQEVELVGLSTLDVVAVGSGAKEGGDMVASILDARRKELFFGLFRCQEAGFPEAVRPPFIADPATLAQELADDSTLTQKPVFFNGSGLGPYGEVFKNAMGRHFISAPETAWNPDAVLLGKLALHRFREHGGDDPQTLQPLYLRRPDAVVKKRLL